MKEKTLSTNLKNAITSEVMNRKARYSDAKKLMHNLRRLRFMRVQNRPMKPFARLYAKNIHAPMAYRLVQTATGAIAKTRPVVYVEARTPGQEDLAAELQRACMFILDTLERDARKPLFWKFIDQCAGDGMGVWKLGRVPWTGYPIRANDMDDSAWNAEVSKFEDSRPPIPIRARLVDPMTFYPPMSEWGAPSVMESGMRSTRETFKTLRLVRATGGLQRIPDEAPWPEDEPPPSYGPSVEVDEIWTPEEAIFVFGKGEVVAFENDETLFAGRLPYSWATGEVTGLDDPALASLSVIFPLMYLQPWMDTLLAVMAAWSILGANPTPVSTQDHVPGMPVQTETQVSEFRAGQHHSMPTGRKMGFLQPPPVGTEINNFLNIIRDLIDRMGMSPIVAGYIGSRTPGLTQAAAMEAAVSRLSPIVSSAQFCMADVLRLFLHVQDKVVGKALWVSGYEFEEAEGTRKKGAARLSLEAIRSNFDIIVSLGMDTLQDLISKGTHGAFMQNAGLWSVKRAQQFSGVENVATEADDILRDKVRNLPLVQAYLAAQAVGDDETLSALAEVLASRGLSPEAFLAGETPEMPAEVATEQIPEQEGPGQGLGEQNLGGPPTRGGGKPAGMPTQRPRGRRGGR